MIADFCNAIWDTRIESDAISSDGFEVSNLISRNATEKQRGFLAERFVKPVVSILVSFPFHIDVCAININPRVSGQKICGLEILSASLKHCSAQNKNPNVKGDTKSDVAAKTNDHIFHSYSHVLNVNNIKAEFNCLFNQILRIRLTDGMVGHFVNPCFKDVVSAEFNSTIVCSLSTTIQTCNLPQGNRVHNISHLWIRITQVHKGSVPCLGAVEVIGKPSKNNKEFVMNYANLITLRLAQERNNPKGFVFNPSSEANLSTSNSSEQVSKNDLCNEASLVEKVPSEFIDPITLNVMTLPILLPSGNTIDNSTLEKHIAVERSWGRQPCDPFTGVPLGSKVVPNAALKYRIDNFLLSDVVKVDELGRTVGSSSDCKSTAKLKFDDLVKQERNKKGIGKRKSHAVSLKQPPRKKQNEVSLSGQSSSLDQALENVLSVGQKSTHITSVKTSSLLPSELQHINCTNSGNKEGCSHQEGADVLFQLPCQHVTCRQCLTCAVKKKQCLYCQANFERKDVIRVHSTRTFRIETGK